MNRPNIIFLIWDACRRSELEELNGTFSALAADNISCQRAVAPASWSLPSHFSFLTGAHPSTHGVCTEYNDSTPELGVLTNLHEEGYLTYGISSNGYFSPEFDFDSQFDDFEYTIETWKDEGISVSEFVKRADEVDYSGPKRYLFMLSEALRSQEPFASLCNLSLEGLNILFQDTPLHPALESSNGYQYSATWNTRRIEKIIESHSDDQRPFAIFANYMDTHFPYYPRENYSLLDELKNYRRYHRLNEDIGHQFRFLERLQSGAIEETDVARIRDLYRGEVQTLDDHLKEIRDLLEQHNLTEDTLLIVTADHGEILGEKDELGCRRMGHPDSINDDHLQVPLLIANPLLEDRTLTCPIESRNLADVLCLDSVETDSIVNTLKSEREIAVVESPAHKKVELKERYPDLPDEFIQEYIYEHFVVGYSQTWKVVQSTSGLQHAWKDSEQVPPDQAPEKLLEACRSHLAALKETEPLDELPQEEFVSETARQQLQDLGYV